MKLSLDLKVLVLIQCHGPVSSLVCVCPLGTGQTIGGGLVPGPTHP